MLGCKKMRVENGYKCNISLCIYHIHDKILSCKAIGRFILLLLEQLIACQSDDWKYLQEKKSFAKELAEACRRGIARSDS